MKKGRGIVFYGDLHEAIPLGGTSNLRFGKISQNDNGIR